MQLSILLMCLLVMSCSGQAFAEDLRVAVAANFIRPMKEIIRMYSMDTGKKVSAGYSSTGRLYAQIIKKAPYDLFLAADGERPALLHEKGICKKPFVYARGRIIAWSRRKEFASIQSWNDVMADPRIRIIGLPNPETAPYGSAAVSVLKSRGLWTKNRPKVVYAQNVAQAFQYGQRGLADVVFTSYSYGLSELGLEGLMWEVAESELIEQQACEVQSSGQEESHMFVRFLQSKPVQDMLAAYGYQ
jgi:molybdate transport system substrate-binding protein